MARKSTAARKSSAGAGPSQRQLRVGELVRHKLAELLARGAIYDDVLARVVVSISEVRMSPDLKLATVFVHPLGEAEPGEIVDAFERNKRFIRGETMSGLGLKFTPDLRFRYDASLDEVQRIDALLNAPHVRQDIEK